MLLFAGSWTFSDPLCCVDACRRDPSASGCICAVFSLVFSGTVQVCQMFTDCCWGKHFVLLRLCPRYPYYALAVLGREFDELTWLRYTVWIPLYPIGFTCEGLLVQ